VHIPLLVKSNPIPLLHLVGKLEGISFLLLLGVAMPLKYFAGMPKAVSVVGLLHGILFIAFCVLLLRTFLEAKWSIGRAALVFGGALFPAGPFLLERRMKQYEAEFASKAAASPAGEASKAEEPKASEIGEPGEA
jgi:integral membrane protein